MACDSVKAPAKGTSLGGCLMRKPARSKGEIALTACGLLHLTPTLIIQPQRTQDGQKSILIGAVVFVRTDGNHIEQVTVAELSRYHTDNLGSTGCLIHIVERYQLADPP